MDSQRPKFRLTLRLYPTEQGGRKSPILDDHDFRCPWNIGLLTDEGKVMFNDAVLRLTQGSLAPGEAGEAELVPYFPESWQDVNRGSTIQMWEGRITGEADVLDRIDP